MSGVLFSGIHEVVCKQADGKLYIGFFDDEQKALASVSGDYAAVWYSLNPLIQLPEGATLNPSALARSNRSKKDWMSRRSRFLVDCDPIRDPGNASDTEKASAYEQAVAVREYLKSLGWPAPMTCDSGNGYHLLFAVDLPNDQASEDLIRSVLVALAAKFDTAGSRVDTGNFEANRICKMPGTWARKAAATPERPHRQASVIECPEILEPVARPLLESLAAGYAPELAAALKIPVNDGLKMDWLRAFLERYKVAVVKERQTGQRYFVDVTCPWMDEHGSPSGETASSVGYERGWGYSYKCFHSECVKQERGWSEFRQRVEAQNPDVPPLSTALPGLPEEIGHAAVARHFMDAEPSAKNHAQLYDLGQRAVFVGTRWTIGDSGDLLLLADVGECCGRLRHDMPEPESSRDPRAVFLNHPFRVAVLRQVETLLPTVNYGRVFDQNGYLLGLPDGKVIDIRTAEIRTMQREDYITKRINVMPDAKVQTPVFDKFMREISNENGAVPDAEWIAYMHRFCGYCLLGEYPEHVWSIWVGTGRNGKGALQRVLEAVLGDFAATVRWTEIQQQQMGGENTLKRCAFRLMGARVAFVTESGEETGRRKIETSTIKYLTGGDMLVGAAMRQNDVQRKPSHKLVTVTNFLPIIQPEPAMRGRVQVVPFRASFLGREDATVEPGMRREAPGILHRWMLGAREFLEVGLKPPAAVLDASREMFAEADTVGRFFGEYLDFTPAGFVKSDVLQAKYSQFNHEIGNPDSFVDMAPLYRRLKAFAGHTVEPVKFCGVRGWKGINVRDEGS
jgi:P4 family phage/plasmid primase-like protien